MESTKKQEKGMKFKRAMKGNCHQRPQIKGDKALEKNTFPL